MNEINVIRRELRALGITRRCRCYGRIVMAIQLAVDQEDSLEAVTKEIYWEVGSRCGRKWTAVERNIRTAVQIAWRTNPELLREMAGYPLDGPHRIGIFGDPVQRCAAGDGEKRGGSVFNSRNMTEKGGESRPVHCTGERKTV